MAAAGIPTAAARTCRTPGEAEAALDAFGPPYVVKADGLAAGKGVLVTGDRGAARRHAAACGTVVIEEFLDGPEVSVFALADGARRSPLLPAQDFKRAHDGDQGRTPAAWAPTRRWTGRRPAWPTRPWPRSCARAGRAGPPRRPVPRRAVHRAEPDLARAAGDRVQRAVRGPGDPGRPGPAGDPARRAAATRRPPGTWPGRAPWSGRRGRRSTWSWPRPGYPEAPVAGDEITGLADAAAVPGAYVLQAGTATPRRRAGLQRRPGPRTWSGPAPDVPRARAAAYAGRGRIRLRGGWYRTRHRRRPLPGVA